MALQDCLNFITTSYISEYNVANKEALPYFSFAASCNNNNQFFPASLNENQIGVVLARGDWFVNGFPIYALFVPANWSVQLITSSNNRVTINGPYLGNVNENAILFNNGTSIFPGNDISFAIFTRRPLIPGRGIPQSFSESAVQICSSNEGLTAGGVPIPIWEPHQPGCDVFVTAYCQTQHPEDHVTCTCIEEAASLQKQHPEINLPVTCFGPLCGSQGYRTNDMARELCSVTACQTILFEKGNEIYNSGKTEIYCNGHLYDTHPSGQNDPNKPNANTPAVLPTPTPHDTDSIPYYLWIILGIVVAVAGLLIYFIWKKYGIPST